MRQLWQRCQGGELNVLGRRTWIMIHDHVGKVCKRHLVRGNPPLHLFLSEGLSIRTTPYSSWVLKELNVRQVDPSGYSEAQRVLTENRFEQQAEDKRPQETFASVWGHCLEQCVHRLLGGCVPRRTTVFKCGGLCANERAHDAFPRGQWPLLWSAAWFRPQRWNVALSCVKQK